METSIILFRCEKRLYTNSVNSILMQKIKKEGLKTDVQKFFQRLDDDTYVEVIAYIKNDMKAYALKRHYHVEII